MFEYLTNPAVIGALVIMAIALGLLFRASSAILKLVGGFALVAGAIYILFIVLNRYIL